MVKRFLMKSEWFDPHKSFLSLGVVWVTVGTLLSMSIASASVIINNSELTVDLSFNGFNQFISIFRFPLGIAALIIPMVALLAANHRSEQTKEQIRVTNAQNVFSNYYKHIEEFIKYLDGRVVKDIDLRFVHNKIFPKAAEGDYSLDDRFLLSLYNLDELPALLLKYYPSDSSEKMSSGIININDHNLMKVLSFIYREPNDCIHYTYYEKESTHGNTYLFMSKSLIKSTLETINLVELFCKFSVDYVSPISRLTNHELDLNKIYVYKNRPSNSPRLMANRIEDQTFEQANEVFLEMLKKIVNSD